MAEVVILAIGALGLAVYAVAVCANELRQLRREVIALREAVERTNGNTPVEEPRQNHPLTTATQFAGNALVRAWWLGEQGRKRAQEEE